MLKLPVGYDNFRKVIDNRLDFVDKSLFIKEVIDNRETEIIVITRPRRFGKTLNISMLQHFLAAEVDGQLTKGMFANLKITQVAQGEYSKHQGQYPVMFISLKDIKKSTFQDALKSFRLLIQGLYRAHRVILTSNRLTPDEKELCKKFLEDNTEQSELENSLKILSEFLYKHRGVKPYLLVDEYDTPINMSFQYGYYDEMIIFIRNLFGASLKGNQYIAKAVVTGILRIAKESIFSDLNNIKVYSLLNPKYSQYFGFTEEEVNDLLERCNLKTQAEEIKKWYNGYQFGETIIYNPWSIVNCLNENGKLQPYWLNTSENALVKKLLATADEDTKIKLESLVRNETIEATIDEYVTFMNFSVNPCAIWSLLLSSGYLKAISCEPEEEKLKCILLPPNYEVYLGYRSMVKEWLATCVGQEKYDYFIGTLLQGNIADFTAMLKKFLLETLSVFDVENKNPEKFYHGLVLGLISSTLNTHIIKSNRESGYGKYDVMVIPKDLTKPDAPGLVMEFKVAGEDEVDDLKASAQKALEQIEKRNYAAEMRQAGVNKIIKVGLAFWKKEVEVVYVENI